MKSNVKCPMSNVKLLIASQIIFLGLFTSCWAITGDEIINKVDANMTFNTARIEAAMIIHVDNEVRKKEMLMYERGKDTGYAEFLSPARDKGVKYLKIKDNMWMYLPDVDKIIKIAGHMLRQSMMGSDFSYEDALESSKLLEKYTATLISEEVIAIPYHEGEKKLERLRDCYVVNLVAKVKEVTYYQRMMWVDKEYMVPVREDLFAMSGKKLKTSLNGDFKKFGARYYPMYGIMSNLLRQNSYTEFVISKVQFDLPVPASTFTQGNLTK